MNGDGKHWNLGDVLHLVQIAILLISLGVAYERFQIIAEQVTTHTQQLERVEHYLSSKDQEYWRTSRNQ